MMASRANERLCRAAGRGDVAGIAAALLAGANPNAFEGTIDMTPLQEAASSGHVIAIAALVAAGARVDTANSFGITPLMYAAASDRTAAIDALLTAGADVHRANNDDNTALHWASMDGHLDAARVLLEAGARTDVRDEEGQRPIDEVGAPARSLGAATRLRHPAALPCRCAQVRGRDEDRKAALAALLASAEPWSRRRPVAVACYGDEWEWEE
jgi:hypothetical protein